MDHQRHGRRVSRPFGGEGQAERQPLIRTATATRTLLPQSGPRTRWAADYRAFRTADRLWARFQFKLAPVLGRCEPSFVRPAPVFDPARLQGDVLALCGYHPSPKATHRAGIHEGRMAELSRPVRLPR